MSVLLLKAWINVITGKSENNPMRTIFIALLMIFATQVGAEEPLSRYVLVHYLQVNEKTPAFAATSIPYHSKEECERSLVKMLNDISTINKNKEQMILYSETLTLAGGIYRRATACVQIFPSLSHLE